MVDPSTADIRQYLTTAYSDEELGILCADYFRDVYDAFAAGMTKTAKVGLLIDHCQRRGLLPNLLAALERDRREQYRARFGPAAAEPRPAPPPAKRDPRQAFISHAHEDAEFAHRLAADLAATGWRVWIAPDSIRPGEMWVEAIDRGLEESGVFVLVLTPFAVGSDWVKTETRAAIALAHKGRMRFVPAEVVSCEAPPLWEAYQWIPFAGRYERGLAELVAALGGASVKSTPVAPAAETQRSPEPPFPVQAKEQPAREQPAKRSDERSATQAPASQPAAPKVVPAPDLLTIESPIHLELVRVPAGEFLMGSDPKVDKDALDAEQPQHRLILPEFYIGKYPVTNAQYAVFVKATRQKAPGHWQIPAGKDDHPAVNVTWRDAMAFCRWLSQASGKAVRLPTEAEWEKAASWEVDQETGRQGNRGRKRKWPWGDTFDQGRCNTRESGIGGTMPVDRYPAGASPCGALDMAGNTWEWTGSLYRPYPYQPDDGRNAPDGAGERVVRGGSWLDFEWNARCAVRNRNIPVNFYAISGFRVVVSLSF